MDKAQLLELINKLDKNKNADKSKVLGWVNALKGTVATRRPTRFKVGDVFMHPHFSHPYVLLRFKDNQWFCGLITSEKECPEILEECNSRFFTDNYFTKVIFTCQEPIGTFANVYDNSSQLKRVLKSLRELFG